MEILQHLTTVASYLIRKQEKTFVPYCSYPRVAKFPLFCCVSWVDERSSGFYDMFQQCDQKNPVSEKTLFLPFQLQEHKESLDVDNSRDYLDDLLIGNKKGQNNFSDLAIIDTLLILCPDAIDTGGQLLWIFTLNESLIKPHDLFMSECFQKDVIIQTMMWHHKSLFRVRTGLGNPEKIFSRPGKLGYFDAGAGKSLKLDLATFFC